MTKTILTGKEKLPYTEIEENRKSFSITLYPSGKLVFKTPVLSTKAERKRFLLKKAGWIQKQRDFFKQFHTKKQSFTSGSDVLYLGRHYQLIIKKQLPEKICFTPNKLIIYSKQPVQKILYCFMQSRAEKIFKERLKECLKLFPAVSTQPQIKIRKMNKRWGSYYKGDIILNPQLIKAPKRCIDYVILHELCHFKYKDHNKDFFVLLQQKCPDYKALKTELELKLLG